MKKSILILLFTFTYTANGISQNIHSQEQLDSLFYYAFCDGNDSTALYYLSQGANIDALHSNVTLLQIFSMYGGEKQVTKLIKWGANINFNNGITPLIGAIIGNHENIIYLLLNAGAKIDEKDSNGHTVAEYANFYGLIAWSRYFSQEGKRPQGISFETLAEKLENSIICGNTKESTRLIKILKIKSQKELSPNSIYYNKWLYGLEQRSEDNGNYKEAESYLQQIEENISLSINAQPKYEFLITKANFYHLLCNETMADSILLICLNSIDEIYNEETKANIYQLAYERTKNGDSEQYYKDKLINSYDMLLSIDTAKYITSYILARLDLITDDKNESNALRHKEQELKAIEGLCSTYFNDDNNIAYLMTYYNYADFYLDISDYDKADYYAQKVLNISAKIFGTNNIIRLGALRLSAISKKQQIKCESAFNDILEANKICNNTGLLGTIYDANIRIEYANILNYAYLVGNDIDIDRILDSYNYALNIYLERLDYYDARIAITCKYYAMIMAYLRDYKSANFYGSHAYNIFGNITPPNDLKYLYSALDLAGCKSALNEVDTTNFLLNNFIDNCRGNIQDAFSFLSESQRQAYWDEIQVGFTGTPSIAFSLKENNQYDACYNASLTSKGVLLNANNQIQDAIKGSNNQAVKEAYKKLCEIKSKLLSSTISLQSYDSLRNKAEDLDKFLVNNCAPYKEGKNHLNCTWQEVQDNLQTDEVAIEYISFDFYRYGIHYTDSTMYCALLLRKGYDHPIMVPLFEEKELALLANEQSNSPKKVYDYTRNGQLINEKIWQPLTKYIKEGETVYFSPSGMLHQLNIESLPYDSTSTLSDHHNMVRLSSTRELVLNHGEPQNITATLYGGLQYDVDTTNMIAESRRYDCINTDLLASRSIEVDSTERIGLKYLPGTKTEVTNIDDLLTKKNLQVQLFTAQEGNEESFKALSGTKPNILHIATHGFFWSVEKAQARNNLTNLALTDNFQAIYNAKSDPMMRSGLLLSGANLAYLGRPIPEGVQDGILTSKEISLLDLRGCDLAVLSACETGYGEITSEGVFGLQRAFKQAGVQTIIMSLWKVNDQSTQEFMSIFYEQWLNGKSKREAFNIARQKIREKYNDPYYWAAFIMLD